MDALMFANEDWDAELEGYERAPFILAPEAAIEWEFIFWDEPNWDEEEEIEEIVIDLLQWDEGYYSGGEGDEEEIGEEDELQL